MDAVSPIEQRFLPALAEAVAVWFPELGGRALAVSECEITKENVPTLPLAMVAFVRSTAEPPARSSYDEFEIQDAFVVEFWLEPARYKKANGAETPFWSYYPYEAIRDTLLANLIRWSPPGGERLAYRGLTISADALAVTLTFAFIATFTWCTPVTDFGEPFSLGWSLCTPKACVPDCLDDCIDECLP